MRRPGGRSRCALPRAGSARTALPAPRNHRAPQRLRRPGAVRAGAVSFGTLLVATGLFGAALFGTGPALAQAGPSVRGTFEVRYAAAVGWRSVGGPAMPGAPTAGAVAPEPDASLLLGAHADLDAGWRPLHLTVRLDPAMSAAGGGAEPAWEPGLTEAFALVREGPVDVSAGLERLPLETARLTVPFQIEPLAADGTRRGLWGARVAAYTGPLRLRAAGFLVPPGLPGDTAAGWGDVGGALSVRADLTSAQLEAHVLYLRAPAFGASASGTVGETVLYGEAWLLAGPWSGRGALGASGYLGTALGGALSDALWTLEAAYAPPPAAPALDALPQLAAQLDAPLINGDTLHAFADVGLADSRLVPGEPRLQGSVSLLWETGGSEATLQLGPSLSSGELGTRLLLQAKLTATTGF